MQYLKHKESLYEEAEIEMTPQKLMGLAVTKYNTLKEQDLWDQDSQAGDEIIALKAEIALLKQQTQRKSEQKRKNDDRFAWKEKKVAGKETLIKNSKTYYWCPYHKAYTIHKPDDCRLATKKPKVDRETNDVPVSGMTAVYEEDGVFNAFGDEVTNENDE